MRDIVWTRGAEADLQTAYDEIEGFQEGSGEAFFQCFLDVSSGLGVRMTKS